MVTKPLSGLGPCVLKDTEQAELASVMQLPVTNPCEATKDTTVPIGTGLAKRSAMRIVSIVVTPSVVPLPWAASMESFVALREIRPWLARPFVTARPDDDALTFGLLTRDAVTTTGVGTEPEPMTTCTKPAPSETSVCGVVLGLPLTEKVTPAASDWASRASNKFCPPMPALSSFTAWKRTVEDLTPLGALDTTSSDWLTEVKRILAGTEAATLTVAVAVDAPGAFAFKVTGPAQLGLGVYVERAVPPANESDVIGEKVPQDALKLTLTSDAFAGTPPTCT